MLSLNLPHTDLRLRKAQGKIQVWDHIRLKWITLTPEEWVRQQFTHWLVEHLGYPRARLAHEVSLRLGSMQRRCDAIVYDHEAKPLVILEFKAPHISISQATFDQTTRYNATLRVPYLIISNGMSHYCAHIDTDKSVAFLNEIPRFADL